MTNGNAYISQDSPNPCQPPKSPKSHLFIEIVPARVAHLGGQQRQTAVHNRRLLLAHLERRLRQTRPPGLLRVALVDDLEKRDEGLHERETRGRHGVVRRLDDGEGELELVVEQAHATRAIVALRLAQRPVAVDQVQPERVDERPERHEEAVVRVVLVEPEVLAHVVGDVLDALEPGPDALVVELLVEEVDELHLVPGRHALVHEAEQAVERGRFRVVVALDVGQQRSDDSVGRGVVQDQPDVDPRDVKRRDLQCLLQQSVIVHASNLLSSDHVTASPGGPQNPYNNEHDRLHDRNDVVVPHPILNCRIPLNKLIRLHFPTADLVVPADQEFKEQLKCRGAAGCEGFTGEICRKLCVIISSF